MATAEGKVKQKVKAMLRKYNAYYEMPVPGGFGKAGLDFIICANGYFLSVETKAPGNKPTPRQLNTMRDIATSGGAVMVVHDDASLAALEAWLKITKPIKAMDAITETMEQRKELHMKDQRKKYDH